MRTFTPKFATFGALGIQDKAKHLATLYLEDLSDLIQECVDPHFGFSRYAERLGRSANHFDELYDALQEDYTYVDHLLAGTFASKKVSHGTYACCFGLRAA